MQSLIILAYMLIILIPYEIVIIVIIGAKITDPIDLSRILIFGEYLCMLIAILNPIFYAARHPDIKMLVIIK